MPPIVDGFGGTLWSTKWRKTITLSAAMVGAVLGAYTQIKANADDLEHMGPASRPYARLAADDAAKKAIEAVEQHQKQDKESAARVDRVLNSIRIDSADGKREATQNDLFKAGLEMKKAVKAGDEDTQQYIQKEIIRLQATLDKLNTQKETLNKKPSGD